MEVPLIFALPRQVISEASARQVFRRGVLYKQCSDRPVCELSADKRCALVDRSSQRAACSLLQAHRQFLGLRLAPLKGS